MTHEAEHSNIPVLALRDVVVYPHMVIPLFVGREKSIACLEQAMECYETWNELKSVLPEIVNIAEKHRRTWLGDYAKTLVEETLNIE